MDTVKKAASSAKTNENIIDMEVVGASATITSTFGFTNITAGKDVGTTNLGLVNNYGKVMDEATEARITNKTCPLDQGELVTYRNRDIERVSTLQQIMYPARVLNGIEFGVRLDEILRTKADNDVIICDEPIVLTFSCKCPKSSNISDDVITECFNRMLGALTDAAGNYRWSDLMRSSLVPVAN